MYKIDSKHFMPIKHERHFLKKKHQKIIQNPLFNSGFKFHLVHLPCLYTKVAKTFIELLIKIQNLNFTYTIDEFLNNTKLKFNHKMNREFEDKIIPFFHHIKSL